MKIRKIKYKDYIYEWLLNKKVYIKESSYANYSNLVFNYIIPKIGELYLENINNKIIQDYILELYNNGLSIKTIKDIVSVIKNSLYKAFNENKIKVFRLRFNYPKDNFIKNIYVLSRDEQNKIINYVFDNINNKTIGILLSLFLGVRIGELCALKWKDIDFKNNMLNINKTIQRIYIKDKCLNTSKIIITNPKTFKAIRNIPINKDLLEILKTLKSNNDNYILSGTNKYIEPRSYRMYFNNVLKIINVEHFNFHSLRHTFATNCVQLGIDYKTVSELLGHSSINITLNLYVHPRLSQKKKCIEALYKKIVK